MLIVFIAGIIVGVVGLLTVETMWDGAMDWMEWFIAAARRMFGILIGIWSVIAALVGLVWLSGALKK